MRSDKHGEISIALLCNTTFLNRNAHFDIESSQTHLTNRSSGVVKQTEIELFTQTRAVHWRQLFKHISACETKWSASCDAITFPEM